MTSYNSGPCSGPQNCHKPPLYPPLTSLSFRCIAQAYTAIAAQDDPLQQGLLCIFGISGPHWGAGVQWGFPVGVLQTDVQMDGQTDRWTDG